MSAQRPSRKHHYIPVSQLLHFCDGDDVAWVFDKTGRFKVNPRKLSPRSIGFENGLYTLGAAEEVDGAERWLNVQVDGPASSALREVASADFLDDAWIPSLAGLIASKELRSPYVRDFTVRLANTELRDRIRAEVVTEARVKALFLENQLGEPSQAQIDSMLVLANREFSNEDWIDFLQTELAGIKARLESQNWGLIRTTLECPFVLTDVGALKFRQNWHGEPVSPAPAWMPQANGWFVPLTSTRAVLVAPDLNLLSADAKPDTVQFYNSRLAQQARSMVLAVSREALERAMQSPLAAS
jgi:hypothetical protein